jgi:hypothetical protein
MAVTDPVPRPRGYVAERFQRDGCGYWPAGRIPRSSGFANGSAQTAVKSAPRATDQVGVQEPQCTARIGDIQDGGCAHSR